MSWLIEELFDERCAVAHLGVILALKNSNYNQGKPKKRGNIFWGFNQWSLMKGEYFQS